MKTLVWEIVYICQGKGDYEPPGRYRHEVAFDGRNIYILGGGTAEEVYDFSEIPAFDIEKREWNKRKTLRDIRGKKWILCYDNVYTNLSLYTVD